MTPRFAVFLILTAAIGCHSPMVTPDADEPAPPAQTLAAKSPPPPEIRVTAATPVVESPADHLAEAGRCLERDDRRMRELMVYLEARPEAPAVRVQYAEIWPASTPVGGTQAVQSILGDRSEQKTDASLPWFTCTAVSWRLRKKRTTNMGST